MVSESGFGCLTHSLQQTMNSCFVITMQQRSAHLLDTISSPCHPKQQTNHRISYSQVSKLERLTETASTQRTAGLIRKRQTSLKNRNKDELLLQGYTNSTELRFHSTCGLNGVKSSL